MEDKYTILGGDSLAPESWARIPDGTVQAVITSPPYWGLRDYGNPTQLGREGTPDEYISNLVRVFQHIRPKLKDDGTLWINIGDTYVGTGHKKDHRDPKAPEARTGQATALNHKVAGLKPKDMIGVPWRLAFALQQDGWFLRSDIIWHKPNAQPSPVTDRPVSSYEHVFLLSKSRKYYYDWEAVQETTTDGTGLRRGRDVWSINTEQYKEAHFAVFPQKLVEPCVLASSKQGDIILDPFSGSGTTGLVAVRHDRKYIGMESNPDYVELSKRRLGAGTSS